MNGPHEQTEANPAQPRERLEDASESRQGNRDLRRHSQSFTRLHSTPSKRQCGLVINLVVTTDRPLKPPSVQPLQTRELATFAGMIEKLVIGTESTWNNVRSRVQKEEMECTSQLSRYLLRMMCGGPR